MTKTMTDEFGFLKDVTNWCNHRPFLLLGLSITKGRVIEMGAGLGSSPYLSKYCDCHRREFLSYDSNAEWAVMCDAKYVKNWDDEWLYKECGLAFLDFAPGEERHIAAKRFKDKADIIVLHDSEEGGCGNYMYDKIWPLFKWRLNYNRTGGGAGASMISNKIDLSVYKGIKIGEFEIE